MKVIFLATYTPNALKGLMAGSDRRAAVEAIMQKVGGKIDDMWFTRGEFDVVVTGNLPDSTNVIGVTTALKASGAFEKAISLEELNISDVIEVANKAASAYTPAG